MSGREGRATAGHSHARSRSRSKNRPPQMGVNSPELDRPHVSEGVKLNLVVCGSDTRFKSSISEQILQQTERSDVDLHGRQISLVELPALFNSRLSEEEVMHQTLRCVSLCHPGVHVFLLIFPAGPLTNEDKAEIDKIQKIFSSRINKHIMILIMQNSEQTTAELNEETKSVIESFGGRHYFFGPTTQVSTLMENVEQMVEENRGGIFSTETFLEAQMKKLQKLEKKNNSLEAYVLSKESDDLRIVLLGKTGVGKSATGNTILGRDAFTAEESFQSVTTETQRETAEINGRHVTVIDTPGLFDTERTNEENQREITNCISLVLPGPHVFLLLIPLGRFTPEEAKSVKMIQEMFGENSLKYTMVLFTRGDGLKNKTIEQCLGKPGSPLMNLIEACGNRYHVFNNNQTGDRTQVSDLLEKIDNMVEANGGSFYSCKMFRQMEREKQEQQMKFLMERVEQLNKEREELINKLKGEKERTEREKQGQLELLEKMLKEERKMREDQQKIFEEKLKLQQHEDELKRRQMKLEGYEREKEEMKNKKKKKKKICSKTDDPLKVAAYSKLETEYDTWSWCLRSAMMEIENKLHNKIENETFHLVKEIDLQRELKTTSEEVKRSMSEFFEEDTDAKILIQWKTSFEIKIIELQENIVRETWRKLNEILQQRDLKKKIDAQRTHHENTLYEKSKELALKLKDKANDDETLKKEFDVFWEESVKNIIRDTPPIKDIDIMKDVREILSDAYGSVSVDQWKERRDIFSVQSYSEYVIFKKFPKGGIKEIVMESLGLPQTLKDEAQIRLLVTDVVQQTDRMIQSFNIAKMGYNISCIRKFTGYIKKRVTEHQEGAVKYEFKNEFIMDLVVSIIKRANKMITDQHKMFREANDPVIYVKKKREEYYNIFKKHLNGATSAAIFGEIICQKLKEPLEQSVYKKTARYLTDEMRSNCESLNGNRSKLEKHILKTLAEKEDFDKYMNYIDNPRDHFKSFIRDEVSRYITDKFSVSVLHKMKKNTELLQQKIMEAAHESTEHVQVNRGDVDLWLNCFTQKLSDELIFSEKDLSGVKHDDVDNFNLLEDVIRQELPAVLSDISIFNRETFDEKLDLKERPDELLIDHLCQCCWVQCPFCGATCTNTIEDHDGDHSVPFHRINGLNGWFYRGTTNLSVEICTSAVASDASFYPNDSDDKVLWRDYRKAGGVYADWSITPDLSELPYWKWFVCKFQKDLEKHYNKTFEGSGEIPEWRKYTNHDAIESLDQYI